jgi:hypothetical protein
LWQPTAKNVVQTRDAGRNAARAGAGRDPQIIGFGGTPLASVHSVPVNAHELSTCFDPNRFAGVAPIFASRLAAIKSYREVKLR